MSVVCWIQVDAGTGWFERTAYSTVRWLPAGSCIHVLRWGF